MALNPYTLYHLYEKGILDYVPTDLIGGTPMGVMTPMSNPYLDMAKQGGLYQNHGEGYDSFQMSGIQSPYVQNYQSNGSIGNGNIQIGSNSNVGGMNIYNGYGIGSRNPHTTAGAFGFNGTIGAYSNAGGINAFNGYGVGAQSQTGGLNSFGGFSDTHNGFKNGFNKAVYIVSNTPKFILGVIGGVIGVAALSAAFKRGKKPTKVKSTFWSKLNPLSWFKKKN